MTTDVVVAGGGPVGLATALYAVRAGLSVVVLEPRTGPIDKACGEGLMPGALESLAELGVQPDGVPLRGIRYLDGRASASAPFRHGVGRGVRRTTLHAALRAAVDAAGVHVLPQAAGEIVQDDEGVVVAGHHTRHLIAADGLHSSIRRGLGLDTSPKRVRRFGLRAHVETPPWTDFVEVHWSRHAEAYVTPVAPGLVGVALLTSSRAPYSQQLAAFPGLRARLEGPRSRVLGAGPLRKRSSRRVAGRVLLVGDASGYVDALTGEGIALGMAHAAAAVGAVASGDLGSYEREWRRVSRRYQLLTHALLSASSVPPVRKALVPLAERLPRVFSAAVNELARRPGT